MDKNRIMKEAAKFQGEGECYIHAECKDGFHQAIATGDGTELLLALVDIIEHLSEACSKTFDQSLTDLHEAYVIKKAIGCNEHEATVISMPMKRKNDEENH